MGQILKAVREEQGLTQAEVAARLGFQLEGYRAYEQGYSHLRASAVRDFADALGVPSWDLGLRLGLWDAPVAQDELEAQALAIFGEDDGEDVAQFLRDLRALPTDEDRRAAIEVAQAMIAFRRARLRQGA